MAAHVRTVEVPEVDRRGLEGRARDKGAPAPKVGRARSVLLAAEGVAGEPIGAIVGWAEPAGVTVWAPPRPSSRRSASGTSTVRTCAGLGNGPPRDVITSTRTATEH